MFAFRRTMFAIFVTVSLLIPHGLFAGSPFSHCGRLRCKCCTSNLVVHVCSPRCGCKKEKRSTIKRESGMQRESGLVRESGFQPQIVQSTPQFTFAPVMPMMSMPIVATAGYQQPLRRESGSQRSTCTATCDQIKALDAKITKLSDHMTDMTQQISNNTKLIGKLLERMEKHEKAKAAVDK